MIEKGAIKDGKTLTSVLLYARLTKASERNNAVLMRLKRFRLHPNQSKGVVVAPTVFTAVRLT
jgi:hypothetical protein